MIEWNDKFIYVSVKNVEIYRLNCYNVDTLKTGVQGGISIDSAYGQYEEYRRRKD
jgi:hypothetical protein